MSFQNSREYRHGVVTESVRITIALQIRNMREERGWSQAKLAEEAGTAQSAVARAEDPEYGRLSVSTLFKMALVFDVGLLVKFVPFSRFEREYRDFSPQALAVKTFFEEQKGTGGNRTAEIPVGRYGTKRIDDSPPMFAPQESRYISHTSQVESSTKVAEGMVQARRARPRYELIASGSTL